MENILNHVCAEVVKSIQTAGTKLLRYELQASFKRMDRKLSRDAIKAPRMGSGEIIQKIRIFSLYSDLIQLLRSRKVVKTTHAY